MTFRFKHCNAALSSWVTSPHQQSSLAYSVQYQPMIYFDFIGGNRRLAVEVEPILLGTSWSNISFFLGRGLFGAKSTTNIRPQSSPGCTFPTAFWWAVGLFNKRTNPGFIIWTSDFDGFWVQFSLAISRGKMAYEYATFIDHDTTWPTMSHGFGRGTSTPLYHQNNKKCEVWILRWLRLVNSWTNKYSIQSTPFKRTVLSHTWMY